MVSADTPEELTIAPGTTLRVVASSGELLELEATYAGAGQPPPAHLHPDQDERFEVRSGSMRTNIAGQAAQIAAGDVLEIPRGTVHQTWSDASEPAILNWRTMPAGRTVDWFRELAAQQRGEGRADPATLLFDYAGVFRLAPH